MSDWTIERVSETVQKYAARAGVTQPITVTINRNFTRTLGQTYFMCLGYNDDGSERFKPIKIEISQKLLTECTDHSIEQVIAHEVAHYVDCYYNHTKSGHNAEFRKWCAKIGCTNNRAVYKDIEYKEEYKPVAVAASSEEDYRQLFKYTFYCSKCGKLVAGRHRACKLTKEPENFRSNCCNSPLVISQNW